MKTIQAKLTVIFLLYFLLGTANLLLVLLSGQEDMGVVINLAGRQRMLTQKMTKEALLVAKANGSSKDHQQQLAETAALFDKTLQGLMNGDKELRLPPTRGKEISAQLRKVRALWEPFKKHIDTISGKAANNADFKEALSAIATTNLPLLKGMNTAVKLFEESSARRAAIVRWATLAVVIMIVTITVLASTLIVQPLVITLKEIIHELTEGSHQIIGASDEIAETSNSVAAGATEQASTLEEISATLEQMSAMTKQNADNAQQANSMA
ncbi:MAG: hypothetical protein GY868_12555, partial [Deltaproteobacteria bacterium]|nr:hypothetical protein [Deltaproteobacteria bacterium]